MKERLVELFYSPPSSPFPRTDQHQIIQADGFVKTGE